MKIQHLNLSGLKKLPKFFGTPTLLVLSEREFKKPGWSNVLPKDAQERVTLALSRLKEPLEAGGRFHLPGRAKDEEDLWVAVLPTVSEMFFLLEFARDSLKEALLPSAETLRIVLAGQDSIQELADAFGAATAARVFQMPTFGKRKEKEKPFKLARVELASSRARLTDIFERAWVGADGSNLARYLATLPPNVLDAAAYGETIRKVCKENGLHCKFHSRAELKKQGAGAFLAVDGGKPGAGGIYECEYTPKGKARKTIHLAGKGICFDTGGYDIKTGGHMISMKGDMQGSAIALATLVSASRLKLPIALKAFLAVTENHISPDAYKADEVVIAMNGLSIEVINTDAEGRMVLADTLTLASRAKPACLIDFATLTGAAVRSLGTKYGAGFTNREALHEKIRRAGVVSGERMWTFPTDSSYVKALESKVADTIQCIKGGGPDHILAACFLSKFVEEGVPWVHIDLAASENEGGLGHTDSLFTGFGVRWALEFLKGA